MFEMDKGKLLAGLFVMIGLVLGGMMIPRAVSVYRSYDRTVNVKGLCEREVKADKAIWPLVLKIGGNDLNSIYGRINSQNASIRRFLLDGGIKPSEITESLSVSDKYTMEYTNDRAQRYIVKSVTTVCTDNVDAVVALMARQNELLLDGIALAQEDWGNATEFSFEALNSIKPEMIEEATRNAREAADKFAKDSDSKLGKIKNATQGTFSVTDRDSYTPYIKNVRVVTSVTYYLNK